MPTYLTVHGHFYQPPRENPWTEEIDREPTAEPFHNWNERINAECYRANAFARVLADDGRVVDILNNYALMSFNFGPTLLYWLSAHAPDVYDRIRRGDAASLARLGHGNALAQTYNHMIVPLANRRDKITQVRWGLADFAFRFGRPAEAMWLAETAVDYETLEVLAEHGLRFVILDPRQAARARPLSAEDSTGWQDVGDGRIDPRRAYLCRLPSGRSLAVFFYDGQLAQAVSYGDLLQSSQGFVGRLLEAQGPDDGRPRLVHLATDGETFGHHKRFGERTLVYALTHEAPARGLPVTNYAAFLEAAPPEWEVEIKPGTAWSCAHGLGRWSQDCGCRADGPDNWHQRWRAPLRAALDNLRDGLADIYVREAPALLGDPWEARNAYGDTLPDRTPERLEAFLAQRAGRRLSAEERERALTLLEMQRHAMLMYTSCGWFFTELSGLETAQVLKYAARAMDLASAVGGQGLTARLLADLEKAESNDPAYGHGAEVYRQLVLPAAIGPERVAASQAISALVAPFPVRHRQHAYRAEQTESMARQLPPYALACGQVRLTSEFTSQQTEWIYAALHLGGYNFAASVAPCREAEKCREACARLSQQVADQPESEADLLGLLKTLIGPNVYGLGDLPPADRRRLMRRLDQDTLTHLATSYEQIYNEHMGTLQALTDAHMTVPPELRVAAEYTLSHRLERAAAELAREPGGESAANAGHVLELARRGGLRLERGWARRALENAVVQGLEALVAVADDQARPEEWARLSRLIDAADGLGFDIRPAKAQELMLEYLRARAMRIAEHAARGQRSPAFGAALTLAYRLHLSARVIDAPPIYRAPERAG